MATPVLDIKISIKASDMEEDLLVISLEFLKNKLLFKEKT